MVLDLATQVMPACLLSRNVARFRGQIIKRILFLCRGNICRSPVAERMAKRRLLSCECSSAGFYPQAGRSSPVHLQQAASVFGIDLCNFKSRVVSENLVKGADIVILMDRDNLSIFCQRFPHHIGKVLLLGMFTEPTGEIPDPYDANLIETIRILRKIESGIRDLEQHLRPRACLRHTTPSGQPVPNNRADDNT